MSEPHSWRSVRESNPSHSVDSGVASPDASQTMRGYQVCLAWEEGLEPPTIPLTAEVSTIEILPSKTHLIVGADEGDRTPVTWVEAKSSTIELHPQSISDPAPSHEQLCTVSPSGLSWDRPQYSETLVSTDGIEPPTRWASTNRSTNELRGRGAWGGDRTTLIRFFRPSH